MIEVVVSGTDSLALMNPDEFNNDIKAWADKVKSEVRSSLDSQTAGTGGLGQSIRFSFKKRYGEITRLSLSFDRLAIFIEKGASRGHGGAKGSQWYNRLGTLVSTNENSLNKMNTGSRSEKPFIDPVLNNNMEELSDIVEKYCDKLFVNKFNAVFK